MRTEPAPSDPPGNIQVKLIVAPTNDELERTLTTFLTELHGQEVTVTLADPAVTSALAPQSHHLAWVVYLSIENDRPPQPLPE